MCIEDGGIMDILKEIILDYIWTIIVNAIIASSFPTLDKPFLHRIACSGACTKTYTTSYLLLKSELIAA